MAKELDNIPFELTDNLINQVEKLIELRRDRVLQKLLKDFHHADIADILDELNFKDAIYVIKLLDSEKTSEILMELDEDHREKVLKNLSHMNFY